MCLVNIIGKELQSNVAAQLRVFGFVNDTHSPATDFAEDAVMGNGLLHGLRRRWHWQRCYDVNAGRSMSFEGALFFHPAQHPIRRCSWDRTAVVEVGGNKKAPRREPRETKPFLINQIMPRLTSFSSRNTRSRLRVNAESWGHKTPLLGVHALIC